MAYYDEKSMNSQELLRQVSVFVTGTSYEKKVSTPERVDSAILLLGNLPSTRFAVLEYFGSLYDDFIYLFLSSNDAVADSKTELMRSIHVSLLRLVDANTPAWAPLILQWSVDLLGQMSSKYNQRHLEKGSLTPGASLHELLQLWLACPAAKSLIEIATQCLAAMVGDAPDSCVDALLETSIKHSPHFDWVVAHIGSCFPRTIISRVLYCGLKDYVTLNSQSEASGSGSGDRMRKFKSVVEILGHLAGQHDKDIRHALFELFQDGLQCGVHGEVTEPQKHIIPFMLQLASMSSLLLRVLSTEFVQLLTNDVLNRIPELSNHWSLKANHDAESLLALATHLVTISDQGTFSILQRLLDTAYPTQTESADTSCENPVTSSEAVPPAFVAVQRVSQQILARLLVDLSRVVHSQGGGGSEYSVELPFLKGLQPHAIELCNMLFSAKAEREACLRCLVKYVAVSASDVTAAAILSQTLRLASQTSQLEFWLELQLELQIASHEVVRLCLHDLFTGLLQPAQKGSLLSAVARLLQCRRAVSNLLALVKWEKTASQALVRADVGSCLEGFVPQLCALLNHPDPEVTSAAVQVCEVLSLPELPLSTVTGLCHAGVKVAMHAFTVRDIKQKVTMCSSCVGSVKKLLPAPTAQKTLLRLLLQAAITTGGRSGLGGKPHPQAETKPASDAATSNLLDEVRSFGPASRSHGGVIGQGVKSSALKVNTAFTTEEVAHNQQLFLDLFTTVAAYSTDSNAKEGERKLSSHVTRSVTQALLELLTDDVIYNHVPWPEDEFIRVTIERDLQIRKKFEDNPILWPIFDFLSTGAMCYCSPILRGLCATLILYWDGCRDRRTTASPWQRQATCDVINLMRKGQLLPPPLSYCGELVDQLTPHEVYLLLVNIWRFMKENPPLPEERDWSALDPKHTQVIHAILHKNMDKFGHLFSRFFKTA